jgi:hypothetical protein
MDDTQIRTVIDPAEIARGLSEAPAPVSLPPPVAPPPASPLHLAPPHLAPPPASPGHVAPHPASPGAASPPAIAPPPAIAAPPELAAPPPIEPPPAEPSPDAEADQPQHGLVARAIRSSLPWAASLCLNLAFVLILALFALPLLVKEKTVLDITFLAADPAEEQAEQIHTLAVTSWEHAPDSMTAEMQQLATAVQQEMEIPTETQVESAVEVAASVVDPSLEVSLVPSRETLNTPISVGVTAAPPTEKELNEAGSVEEAVDGIGTQISEMLGQGDLLVVWLFDQSLSLVDDRQRVAARLESVYAQIEQEQKTIASRTGGKPPILTNAVVAYGSGMGEVVAPTSKAGRAVNAIREIPVDPTGLENVFSAVAGCARRYGGSVKRQVFVVIWTDESGDDILLLEPTAALCKKEKLRVSVIGPTAVLGAEEGTHSWVHPANGQLYFLPVKKGPDTPFPERIRWPYWWTTNLPAWHNNIGTRARFEGWYGGYNLASMSSGFPPYALTRLARETGGTMTIFDRGLDSGPFRLSVMRPYSPDYRSAAEILEELRYFPLRQAVLASVEVTRAYEGHEGPRYAIYYTQPPGMRRRLADCASELEEDAEALELATLPFGPEGLENLYERESSPRWRAWYDLTRGRLLAMSVRYAEYRALVELLCRPGGIPDDVNCLQISPAPRLLLGPITESRAREAERLLKRCLEENPDTPWAYLAQRELDHALGVTHRVWYQEPPPPPPSVPSTPQAPVVLPKL